MLTEVAFGSTMMGLKSICVSPSAVAAAHTVISATRITASARSRLSKR